MNRFLRSALFPVVVITLIVWLGTQTLMGHRTKTKKETTSQAINLVKTNPGSIQEVVFNPNKHQAQYRLKDGDKFNVYYATDQAQVRMQTEMEARNVTFARSRASARDTQFRSVPMQSAVSPKPVPPVVPTSRRSFA